MTHRFDHLTISINRPHTRTQTPCRISTAARTGRRIIQFCFLSIVSSTQRSNKNLSYNGRYHGGYTLRDRRLWRVRHLPHAMLCFAQERLRHAEGSPLQDRRNVYLEDW